MTATLVKEASPPAVGMADRRRRARRRGRIIALVFVLPALLLLGALVVYPVVFSVGRSFFDASGSRFVGGDNYTEMFRDPATLKAVRNSAIWVVVAPTLLTGLGLVLAVLVEKIRWATAFKLLLFMPMAVSFLAAGIIFRLAYDEDPDKGVLNAAVVGVHDAFEGTSSYPTARARDGRGLTKGADGSYRTTASASPGHTVGLGLVGVLPKDLPKEAKPAYAAAGQKAARDELRGVVYLDFTPGGGGKQGRVDRGESGLPEMKVEAARDGKTVASTTTAADGSFRFLGLDPGSYTVRLPASNFSPPYEGVSWLGPALVTPAIIGAYLWIWTGFAMVLIGAGLAALPRDALEAARMDGANEWQIFRRITVPLLAPVLTVVFVTLVINVMKVFDLVYIIAPGPVQEDATVLATQMWLVSFGGGNNQGLGSALGVLLLLLVVPAMVFNVRRFRRSQR
ncbi:ABC transporter permease subunit [Streptomyces mirabilis]|jgi:alpha-glucoside transport system permease protein|uniref:ABC transporter permease n=1 Tax=Streptomyces TaxID=1883 RepID=UPI000BB0D2D6|nr:MULTISPECIES: ABC transporter permease subunit [unclassified Streptomyces]PBC99869.1 carbohydrate ABC transporter membrane protein 1 (CUT1 family) [Streptomyces sp. Ag82_O1-15]SOE76768.1 carbohydrate ABC transporter membrane protein 1, CUT1 family [Streptomyces sp. OV198]